MFYSPATDEIFSAEPPDLWLIPLSEPPNLAPNYSFIPGTQIQFVYDSVSLGLLKECPRKYHFKMIEGWDWKIKPVTLIFGINFHTCMEVYHKLRAQGFDFDTTLKRCVRLAGLLGERMMSERNERKKETLVRCVIWYLDQFKNDNAVTALLPDGTPAVELSFQLPIFDLRLEPTDDLPALALLELRQEIWAETGEMPTQEQLVYTVKQGRKLFGKLVFTPAELLEFDTAALEQSFYSITIYLAGHIDRVVHFMDESYVADYKTAKAALDEKFVNKFKPSAQFSAYLAAAHILASQPNSVFPEPPSGLIIDGIQLAVTFNRFQRFFHRTTTEELDKYLADFEATIKVKALGYAQLGEWPAEESSCHNYGGCEFLEVCQRAPAEWKRLLKRDFQKNVWDPTRTR